MSKLVFNRDGGKTDEFGHLLALMRFMQGEVIEGLQVAANGSPNMSVNVPYGVAAIPTGSGATAYRYFVGLDATENVTIPTANGSNPRNDLIVLWVDKGVTPNQSVTNNSNNMLKISVVSGTPASTPADPNTAAIQAAIGAGNPYIILARVVVGASVTQINSGNITDLRSLAVVIRIAANTANTAALQDLAVITQKIADNAITNIKIANQTIASNKIDPTTVPAFKAKKTNAQNSGSNSSVDVIYNSEFYDTTNSYDTSTGLFTAPFDCIMQFKTSVYTEGASVTRAFLTSRGTAATNSPNSVERVIDLQMSGAIARIPGQWEIKMLAGQTFGVSLWTSAAGSISVPDTWFAGSMVARL